MKKVLILAGAAIALIACNKTTGPEAAAGYVKIEPVITKATEVNFETGDKIGLTITKDGETEAYASNALLTYGADAFAGELKWYEDVATASSLVAYYPYSEEGMPSVFTVSADQAVDGFSAYDLMGAAKTGVVPSNMAVTMVFRHLMTKLVINVTNVTGEAVQGVTVKNVLATANVDIAGLSAEADQTVAAVDIAACPTEAGVRYVLLVPSQTRAFTVAVTTDGTASFEQKLAAMTLKAGGQYTIDVVVTDGDIDVTATGEIENWTDEGNIPFVEPEKIEFEEHLDENYFIYHDATYSTVTLSNGQTWMAEPMRYVPEGMAVSSDPADGSGIWYPYTIGDVAEPLTDDASIVEKGYLYNANVYLGGEVTLENYDQFEGVQGICPKGWHIPTRVELANLSGYAQSMASAGIAEITVTSAPFYDEGYASGKVTVALETDWNIVLSGAVISNKYNVTKISATNSTLESLYGQPAMTYFAGSTGYKGTNPQVWAIMTTFTLAKYPEGRLHVSLSNASNGVQVRCIRDGWTE